MKQTLTPAQVDILYDFVGKKYVRYYDVQSELVDHLATAVEERLEKYPNTDFYDALAAVYSEFGLFGFSRIVQTREREMQKLAWRNIWKEVKRFFSWPVIISTLTVLVGGYILLSAMDPVWAKNIICFSWVALMGWVFYREHLLHKKRPQKPLLVLQVSRVNLYFPFFYPEAMLFFSEHITVEVTFLCLVFLMMIRFAALNAWQHVQAKATTQYPGAFAE